MIIPKSICKWLREGNPNSVFFHLFISSRFKHNGILDLRVEDILIEDVYGISSHVFYHFKNKFQESSHRRPRLEGLKFNKLSIFSLLDLEEFIWNSEPDKSSGPDRFNMGFLNVA